MPVELEDRIREAGRPPRHEPDLEALWRSGRAARRRQVVASGLAGVAGVAVVVAVAVTQIPGDGVELAETPGNADDGQEATQPSPPDDGNSGGHNPAVFPNENVFVQDTYGSVELELPDLPEGLAPHQPRALIFPYTEVVAYQSAFGEVDGRRLQALVYVGIDADLDAALRDHEDSEEITLRGRRAVLDAGDAPAVAWQQEPSVVIAVQAMGGVTPDEVLAAAESLTVNRGDLRAAVASHPAQVRAWHREQEAIPEPAEPAGDPVTFEGGRGDQAWSAELRPASPDGLCWEVLSGIDRTSSCVRALANGETMSLGGVGDDRIERYETLVAPEVASVRYRFADGQTRHGDVLDAGGENKLALLQLAEADPELLLVEALDADGTVIDSVKPGDPSERTGPLAAVMAVPPSPLPLSQFEVWGERHELRRRALEESEGR